MKKIILTTLFILFVLINKSYSQNMGRGKIHALKTTYITQYLDLSKSEAEKFWPIYNEFTKSERTLRFKKNEQLKLFRNKTTIDNLTTNEANTMLNELLEMDKELLNLKSNLIIDLKEVISSKKIIKLEIAENEFNRNMLKQLRGRRFQNQRN